MDYEWQGKVRYKYSHSPQGEYRSSRASMVCSGAFGLPELALQVLVLKP